MFGKFPNITGECGFKTIAYADYPGIGSLTASYGGFGGEGGYGSRASGVKLNLNASSSSSIYKDSVSMPQVESNQNLIIIKF